MRSAVALVLLALVAACSGAIVVVSVGTCPERLERSAKPDASTPPDALCPDADAVVWFCQ